MAVASACPAGNPPAVESGVQAGVPPRPFALLNTQTSENVTELLSPANTIIRLLAASYTEVCPHRGSGEEPLGVSCIQVDFPPCPLAFTSTQRSLRKPAT